MQRLTRSLSTWTNHPTQNSDEILPNLVVDRDVEGFIRGLEFLNASRFFSEEAISHVRNHAILL